MVFVKTSLKWCLSVKTELKTTLIPLCLGILIANGAHSESHRSYMVRGEQRRIHLPGLKKYALGNQGTILVLPSPAGQQDDLLVRALSLGVARITVWFNDGTSEDRTLEVIASTAPTCLSPPKTLYELSDVDIIPVIGTTSDAAQKDGASCGYLLRGEYSSVREGHIIYKLLEFSPHQFSNQSRPSRQLYKQSSQSIQDYLGTLEGSPLKAIHDETSRSILIYGSAPNPIQKQIWLKRILELAPFAIGHITHLPDDSPVIHAKVYLLEINRSYLRSLGLETPGSISGALSASSKFLRYQPVPNLEANIQALEHNGKGRVLSQPELVVRAPGHAELFAGGEMPVETRNTFNTNVQWKSFGLQLRLEVQGVTATKIRADLHAEVSSLSTQNSGASAIPGIQSNRMKTQIDAEFGSPILLSGLIQETTRSQAKGVPWLSRIPIFGLLFGSEAYQENRSDFVALLIPERTLPQILMEHIRNPVPLGFSNSRYRPFTPFVTRSP